MSDPTPVPIRISSQEKVFPKLSPAQLDRIASHAKRRQFRNGEILIEQGDPSPPFFVVVSGQIEILRPSLQGSVLVTLLGPGQFTGEVNLIAGRPSFVQTRATRDGEVLELEHGRFLTLVQTDSELSEIIMRAFLLRRLNLVAQGLGDAVLVGSSHSADTLRVKDFLTRNFQPFAYLDLDRDTDVQHLLDRFHVTSEDIPVLICRGERVLKNPSNRQIADCLGFNETVDQVRIRDLLIIGAGPAGLAAAVYGASEGLDVLLLETNSPGGQAGTSSKIENYLGFPTGISGQDLAGRALAQAQKFGANLLVGQCVRRLVCDSQPYAIELEDGRRIAARSIVIATGAEYRRLPLENLSKFEGCGVYYAATFVEAQLCEGEEVIVIGGGNSAGQAAVFLSQRAKHVHLLVRSHGLSETMSKYLIRRIEDTPTITLRSHTEVSELHGDRHLEEVTWKNNQTGSLEKNPIRHLFSMAGATPKTAWLGGCVVLDEKGFIKTGPGLSPEELKSAHWPLPRLPHLLETNLPGIFAVGDVRAESIKRVASAVGEGSIAISFVHQVLHG